MRELGDHGRVIEDVDVELKRVEGSGFDWA